MVGRKLSLSVAAMAALCQQYVYQSMFVVSSVDGENG